jgi:hypothetical protein
MTPSQLETALLRTQADLLIVKRTLGTLIVWMARSANSPIRLDEAQQLVDMLPPDEAKRG